MASNSTRAVIEGLLATGAYLAAESVFAATPTADEVHWWYFPAQDGMATVRDLGLQSGVSIGAAQADNVVTLSATSPSTPQKSTPPAEVRRPLSTASADDPPRRPAIQLEEVVVTARKRAENLQDVPLSAEVISGETLTHLNLNTLTDAAQTTPSIHVNSTGSGGQLFIRGIGSGTSQQFDQSVGTFIDDIYHGRARVADAAFLDLYQVEILKGPQSTFFGNNAIAGAFNILTAKPTDTFEGSVRALYGQFGQYAGEGMLNLPAGETFAVRIAAIGDGLSGWQKNPFAGHDQPDQNNKAGRITFLFRPTENFDALLKVEGGDNRDSTGSQVADCPPPAPFVPAGFCKTALAAGYPTGLDSHENTTSAGQGLTLSTFEDVLTMHYHLGDQTLTSVTGFYNYHFRENDDADGLPPTLFNLQISEKYHQFSQELRIASPLDQTLEYLGGLYFQTDRLDGHGGDLTYYFLTPVIKGAPALAPLVPYLPLASTTTNNGVYMQDEHSYAVFGSLGWNVTAALKLSAGVRGSWVYKTAGSQSFYGTGTQTYDGIAPLPASLLPLVVNPPLKLGVPSSPWTSSRSDSAVQPSTTIQYNVTRETMLFASYSRGFLAGIPTGGIATVGNITTATPPVLPEHVNAYEAGIKSQLFDHRVLLNLDVFRSDYKDLQVSSAIFNTNGTPVSEVTNAGSSRSEGVEFQGEWLASSAFRLQSAVTYLEAHYVSFPNVTLTGIQTFCRANATVAYCRQQFPGGVPVLQDLSGQPTNFAPKWSGNLTATYTITLPRNFHFITEADVFASAHYFFANNATNDPELVQPGYARVDGRFSLESPDQKWSVDILFKNVTDRQIVAGGSGGTALPTSTGSTLIRTEQPRNFALQARYRW
jgi:iron complex outermembrane recepter protein